MEQYCVKCGEKLPPDGAFCPHCGQWVSPAAQGSAEWAEFGDFLARLSLGLAKGLLYLLVGGVVFVCGIGGIGMLVVGSILLYHFATSGFYVLPPALAAAIGVGQVGGAPLAFGGVAAIFIALLFATAAVSIVRAIHTLRTQGKPAERTIAEHTQP